MKKKFLSTKGLELLEMSLALIVLLPAMLGVIDIMNISRAKTALFQASADAADSFGKIQSNQNSSQIKNKAIAIGKTTLIALFPTAKFNCSNKPHCAGVNVLQNASSPGTYEVQMQYRVPTLLSSKGKLLENTTTVNFQSSEIQSKNPLINNSGPSVDDPIL